ncbi:MAG: radical SAM protein [Deltaproteobacteria bacterium]|nr:radical SAM protein [Deltaproteobacteria bacterium]
MNVYGPVPSRRFGLSLGVDLVPHKTCPFDCIYCQLGETDQLIAETADFFDLETIIADVEEALDDEPLPDVITLAGSGEPTLYRSLGPLVDELHELAPKVPVLLITNGSLLWRDEVAAAVMKVDILAPSLDAGDPETFQRINRPHTDVTFERVVQGLVDVTHAFDGEIRLEVMLIAGVNDGEASIEAIARVLETLRFDRIDVNSPVRPPVPERGALPPDESVLERALSAFGPKAHAIGRFLPRAVVRPSARSFYDRDKDIREMLLRRPCTVEDICSSLGMDPQEAIQRLDRLRVAGLVESREGALAPYYHAKGKSLLKH